MKYEQLWKDIETLCALRGPSGREAAVREYLIEQIKGHAEYEVDPLGNLLVRKKGKKPAKKVLQLSAHMDEVGFIITNIDEKGFLSFAPVGGIQPEVTGGRMVLVGDDAIPGMVGCKPVRLCDDKARSAPGKISNMKIDIGAKDKAEAEKLVSLGDMVTFTGPVVHYGEGRVAGRALDDRAGCAMLLLLYGAGGGGLLWRQDRSLHPAARHCDSGGDHHGGRPGRGAGGEKGVPSRQWAGGILYGPGHHIHLRPV